MSNIVTNWEFSLNCARKLDKNDELSSYRDHFFIPNFSGKESLYFTGNSLGLQPKNVQSYIQDELNDWAKWGVEGHENSKNRAKITMGESSQTFLYGKTRTNEKGYFGADCEITHAV